MRLSVSLYAAMIVASSSALAQSKAKSAAPSSVVPPGPSMTETAAWLQSEAPALMRSFSTHLDPKYHILSSTVNAASDVHLSNCVLEFAMTDTFRIETPSSPAKTQVSSYHTAIPLKEIEVGGVAVEDLFLEMLMTEPTQILRIRLRATSKGPQITQWRDGEDKKSMTVTTIDVHNRADGERVGAAIKRAAVLCGAPASPF